MLQLNQYRFFFNTKMKDEFLNSIFSSRINKICLQSFYFKNNNDKMEMLMVKNSKFDNHQQSVKIPIEFLLKRIIRGVKNQTRINIYSPI
jgi:hypothetical protein